MSDEAPPAKKQKTSTEVSKSTVSLRFTGKHKASVLVDKQDVGSIRGELVQRNKRFHEKCDDISDDMEAISVLMFESDGSDRCKELNSSNKGAFLYIETIKYQDGPHKQNSDVGTQALHQFLTALDGTFTVAAYIGDSRESMTREERQKLDADEREEFLMQHKEKSVAQEEEQSEKGYHRAVIFRHGISSDVRQCLRNGFQELSEESAPGSTRVGHMYLTEDRWMQWKKQPDQLSHEASLQVKLRADVSIDKTKFLNKGKDEKLQKYLVEKGKLLSSMPFDPFATRMPFDPRNRTTVASIFKHTDLLVQRGADYNRANSLHACVANGITELLKPLVRQKGALINAKDENHMTPLMVAAHVAPGKGKRKPPKRDIRALLALGADKDIQDNVGKTALGHFYEAMRGTGGLNNFFGKAKLPSMDPTMEDLLRPTGGPTEVDMKCKRKRRK